MNELRIVEPIENIIPINITSISTISKGLTFALWYRALLRVILAFVIINPCNPVHMQHSSKHHFHRKHDNNPLVFSPLIRNKTRAMFTTRDRTWECTVEPRTRRRSATLAPLRPAAQYGTKHTAIRAATAGTNLTRILKPHPPSCFIEPRTGCL